MKYMGSKARHAPELLPIILQNRQPDQWYVEPFVGGFNMIDKVGGNRLASDIHSYLIAMYIAVQDGWIPPSSISEDVYKTIRNCKSLFKDRLVGFVGFGTSFSGKWFGGYARSVDAKGNPRNHAEESKTNILKQSTKIQNVVIENKSYDKLVIPNNSIIYCDPPYQDTTEYTDSFDHAQFWKWAEEKHGEGHTIYVSEYNAPKPFTCIWEKKVNNSLSVESVSSKVGTEKLFTLL